MRDSGFKRDKREIVGLPTVGALLANDKYLHLMSPGNQEYQTCLRVSPR